MQYEKIKIRIGKYRKPIHIGFEDGRIFYKFGYNKLLIAEVKSMQGHKWHGFDEPNPRKIWSVKDCTRNRFALDYLQEKPVFEPYEIPLIDFKPNRDNLYPYQIDIAAHMITRRMSVIAGEMGVGKTLPMIETLEWVQRTYGLENHEAWYIGPVAGVKAVTRELNKWKSLVRPEMMTYEGLVKKIKFWVPGTPPPKVIVFDESSKLKTPTSQRSEQSMWIAEAIRSEWDIGFIILMSGSPAPKAPTDWWNQCEVARPGFLKEGEISKFKARLCMIQMREGLSGTYPHFITWRDDENKCGKCGQHKEDGTHQAINWEEPDYCVYEPSINEVEYLNKRMAGLVMVKLKSECLSHLPDKQYVIIKVKPTAEILRVARTIKETSARTITALTLLRELSDGFQYIEEKDGMQTCPNCHGKGEALLFESDVEIDSQAPLHFEGIDFDGVDYKKVKGLCDHCGGCGEIPKYKRAAVEVPCPKDDILIEELDLHEDIGRYIAWGGFTETIDRIVRICHEQGWSTLRVDGRGYHGESATGEILDSDELLAAMDESEPSKRELYEKYPKVCFVGHPKAGGMALTLTSSPTEFFFSNSFDGEARIQAVERFHRAGMRLDRKPRIVDVFHLASDKLVLDNLKLKKKLQNMTMGQLNDAFTKDVR